MMKGYEKYKPSGVEWIGKIPKHWEAKRLKFNTYIKARVGWHGLKADEFSLADGVFCVTGTDLQNGEINWENCYRVSEERYEEDPYIQLRENDLLITKDGTIGKVAVVTNLNERATLNSGVFVVRPERKEYVTPFMYWALQSPVFSEYVNYTSKGSTINHLYQETFFNLPFILPLPEEQISIASYLDEKTAQIDTLIANKQKLIELLIEERMAIINQAVTKGINPKVKLKPSGIEWVGDIPEHWEVKKLKYVVSKVGSGITPTGGASVYQNEGIPLLRSQNIYDDGLKLDDVANISEDIDEQMSNSRIKEDDVLLNITGASIGRCFYVPTGFGKGNVNQHVCIIRPIQDLLTTKFLHLIIISGYGQALIDACQTGANREGLNFQQIKSFNLPIPDITEQKQIVDFIETHTARLEASISKIEKEIDLLQEYRTVLISEVVTGKIKVI